MASAGITITNNHGSTALAQYRTVYVVIDHATLVAAKRSREDGKDLWVSWAGTSPARGLATYVSRPNTAFTRVYFSLQASIASSGSDTDYTLRWGNLDYSGPPVRVDGLSQARVWSAGGDYQSTRSQPFLFFDDFRWKRSGGSWVATEASDPPDSSIYDVLGSGPAIDRDDSGVTPDVWCDLPYAADTRIAAGGVGDWPSAYRVRAEVYAESGASDPSGGLLGFGQDHASDIRGYTGGLEQAYTTLGLVGHTSGGEVPLDTTAGGNVGDGVLDLQLDIEDTGSATDTRLWARLPNTSSFVSVAAFSDVTRTYSSGWPGFFADGSTSSSPAESIQFRDFAVELWDGVDDSDVSTSVTIPSTVTFPTNFELETVDARLYPVASSVYPQNLAVHRVTVYEQDLGAVELRWKTMTPEDYYQLIAFHDQGKCSATFTATLPGLSSATYRMQAGSLRTRKGSATEYGATVTLRKVAT